ncbi:MAG: hypothetical protein ACP5JE_05155 [Thermoplasmata archaeon]
MNSNETWSGGTPLIFNGNYYSATGGPIGIGGPSANASPYVVVFPGWNNQREDVIDVQKTKAVFGPMKLTTNAVSPGVSAVGQLVCISGGQFVPSVSGLFVGVVEEVIGGGFVTISTFY